MHFLLKQRKKELSRKLQVLGKMKSNLVTPLPEPTVTDPETEHVVESELQTWGRGT